MGAVIASEGARGEVVRTLQECLAGQGYPAGALDGRWGFRTTAAVQSFQMGAGLPVTGEADAATWKAITGLEPPSLQERSLQLSASFEGHDFSMANGNWNGAGITWGIAGFTLRGGGIQAIVREALAKDRALVEAAFGDETRELLAMLEMRTAEQVNWGDRRSSGQYKVLLAPPWRDHFRAFGAQPSVQALQLARVEETLWRPALRTAAELDLGSELGIALCFDIHVQDGGLRRAAAEEVAVRRVGRQPESKRREMLANAVAALARSEYRRDVHERKLAIARGSGTVQGTTYVMRSWGLDESPVEASAAA